MWKGSYQQKKKIVNYTSQLFCEDFYMASESSSGLFNYSDIIKWKRKHITIGKFKILF